MGHHHTKPGNCPSLFECDPDNFVFVARAADTSKNFLEILIAEHDENKAYLIVLLCLFLIAFLTIALALVKTYQIVRDIRANQAPHDDNKGRGDDEA